MTGVQTCALPICSGTPRCAWSGSAGRTPGNQPACHARTAGDLLRSDEPPRAGGDDGGSGAGVAGLDLCGRHVSPAVQDAIVQAASVFTPLIQSLDGLWIRCAVFFEVR